MMLRENHKKNVVDFSNERSANLSGSRLLGVDFRTSLYPQKYKTTVEESTFIVATMNRVHESSVGTMTIIVFSVFDRPTTEKQRKPRVFLGFSKFGGP